jgi:hypothetical protein
MTAWLDENCGADGGATTPSGARGVLNEALSIYFADATLASAFVARWCAVSKPETAGGVFQVRQDEPEPRVGQGCTGRRDSSLDLPTALVTGRAPQRTPGWDHAQLPVFARYEHRTWKLDKWAIWGAARRWS